MVEQTVRELLEGHVVLDVEGIDRLYLNLYQPMLQTGGGVASFFKVHRGAKVAATTLMAPMSHAFVKAIHDLAKHEGVEIVAFAKGQRKDEVTGERLKDFSATEGVLYIGKAQERFASFRVIKKISVDTGQPYPWLNRSSVMCNHYYFYLVDEDFGPLFIKFSSYFPYTARVCLNGHEYAKRQLAKEGIAFEALDNGVLACADPVRLQQILDELDADQDRSPGGQVASTSARSVRRRGPRGWLQSQTIHPASGVFPHPGVRPALVRASPVRDAHPRKPRPGETFQGQPDLRAED